MLKKLLAAVCAVCTSLCVVSCSEVYRYTDYSYFAMNTFITVIGEEDADFKGIEKLTGEYEAMLSRTNSSSEIAGLNSMGKSEISEETSLLLTKALEIASATEGAYNPCMGSIVSLWDITSGKNYVPLEDEITSALSLTDYTCLTVNNNNAVLDKKGIQVDLGGIAKGFTLEKAILKARQDGAENICISFGGNVGVIGSSSSMREDGKQGWKVGITNPFDKESTLGTLILRDGFISVSGAYERFFEKDGKVYHHIFDSKTGKPSQSDLASACVITNDGALGDALSTALFIMGSKKSAEFYFSGQYEFDMILIKNDGEIIVTNGVYEDLSLSDNGFTVKLLEN